MQSGKKTIELLIAELQLICIGNIIHISQKEINAISQIIDILNYQTSMKITSYVAYYNVIEEDYDTYELCPKCGIPLAYGYQPYCGSCGQRLKWIAKKKMRCQAVY